MSLAGYEDTGLWKATLGATPEPSNADALAQLRSSYSTFRERAGFLTSRIAKSLPNLTIHDITHLDALWETADLIAGENYPLNPAEGFVLGGSILLHDSALCFEAYEGGQLGLQNSVEWKDAFSSIFSKGSLTENQAIAEADFAAMRVLHATRAAELANAYWTNPEGEKLYLIENHSLRSHYGELIGQIAASHHWPIEDLVSKLPSQVNALPSFPRRWRVDPVKIACLLRCADAAHIDSRRAPDFLRALSSLHGVSASHWQAQNWLERVDVDGSDVEQTSLIFTSGRPFAEGDAEAWWVAYDAIKLVAKEISSSCQLLESRPQHNTSPPFKIRRVTGALSPEVAAKSIRTSGWEPKSVEIHVSNLEHLISKIGGIQLYGKDQKLSVAIRELIQNARDAIVARRAFDKNFEGKIRIHHRIEDGEHSLEFEDNGIGMSYRVATGPLLDFGKTFWASDLARTEFPGLISSGYKPVGQFGIGFYSVFMVATSAGISTRRFDAGLHDVTQVRFPNGLSLRPLISAGAPVGFPASASTIVKITLQPECGDPSSLLVSKGRLGYEPERRIPLPRGLAVLCAGLDVAVELIDSSGEALIVHRPLRELDDLASRTAWLKNLSGLVEGDESYDALLEHASRLRPLVENGEVKGLAALSTSLMSKGSGATSVSTVGGLATSIKAGHFSRFVGVIDFEAASAKRDVSSIYAVDDGVFDQWVAEQKSLLPTYAENQLARIAATNNLSSLNIDPIDIAAFLLRDGNTYITSELDTLIALIRARCVAFYKSGSLDMIETHHNEPSYQNFPTFWPIANGPLLSLKRDASNNFPLSSAMSCIHRRARELGHEISIEVRPETIRTSLGMMSVWLLRA